MTICNFYPYIYEISQLHICTIFFNFFLILDFINCSFTFRIRCYSLTSSTNNFIPTLIVKYRILNIVKDKKKIVILF